MASVVNQLSRWRLVSLKNILGMVFTALVIAGAYKMDPGTAAGHWYSLLPPLFAIVTAFYTQKLLLSLGGAILLGGILLQFEQKTVGGATYGVLTYIIRTPLAALTDSTNVQIIAFVTLILALISVLIFSGGVEAIVLRLQKKVSGPRSAQIMTVLLGFIIFIDDYANTMIVGSTMRHLTDRYRISREKLAFLVDATSAPVAGIAIVSTWVGYEVGLFSEISNELKMGIDGYSIFFDVLGYRFYCLMMIVFVGYNAWSGRDFSLMGKAQRRASSTGRLLRPSAQPMTSKNWQISGAAPEALMRLETAVIPLMVLLMAVFSGLWFDGGGAAYGVLGPLQYTAWISVLAQSENGSLVLAGAALVSGIVALFLGVIVSQLAFVRLLGSWIGGMRSSLFPIVILLLAWSLKTVCDDLHTGGFIAAVMQGLVSALWFPAIVFIIAGITAFATGTSWGTMAILLPTLVPVAHVLDGGTYGVTTAIVCAAILDGAIMGDHCSPISDTTIMSSIASGSDHLDHVRTQLPYALLVGVLAVCCGYIPAALGWPTWFSLLLATLAIILVHQKLGKNCFWAGRVRSHLDP